MADKKKLASTFPNMVMVLTAIALISALALGFTYSGTKDAIAQVQVQKTLNALKNVLPEFDNDPNADQYTIESEKELVFYPAKKDGVLVGTAVKTYSDKAFAERIWLMVGFTKEKTINKISVLKQKETPGLGTKMAEPKFINQFDNKDPKVFILKVKKDPGGEVDAIAAATITSRAFCDAAQRAYDALQKGGEK
ncbi:MAG: RnfABCDGE type electron transport complex subunit G [bacterium]|nr:RnfABCDGE type electron transport complex subunit G [bacterium]